MAEDSNASILADMRADIAYMRAQLDIVLPMVSEKTKDHESRLRTLERFRYAVPGMAALAFAASVVGLAIGQFS